MQHGRRAKPLYTAGQTLFNVLNVVVVLLKSPTWWQEAGEML